jgi:hypothetical protein
MARVSRSPSIKTIANQRVGKSMWGAPESPEFSAVQQLMLEFKTHESEEERWLAMYKKMADGSDDPLIRFLLNLIIPDQERHRELIARMVSSLKNDLASTRTASLHRPKGNRKKERALLPVVEEFPALEREGIKECERLEKARRGFQQGTFGLLYKTMIHDSLKHILDFLKQKLREQRKPAKRRGRKQRIDS